MRPVVTPKEMAAIDAAAPEPVEELIERAAWAVAVEATDMLGGALYGTRIAVLAGKGNNGADGRSAVRHLERRGARCTVFDIGGADSEASSRAGTGHRFDLIIDACVGTGLTREFNADELPLPVGDTPVLAVDIPSGVDGLTGALRGRPLQATRTITFAALKPGLLLQPGRSLAGAVTVADIGLDCSRATIHHLEPSDVAAGWLDRPVDGHKWRHAVLVVGGSPGMTGAPALSAEAAFRSGAGYVGLAIPGLVVDRTVHAEPREAVLLPVGERWAEPVLAALDRFSAAVIGPGLSPSDGAELAEYLATTTTPTVLDAGAVTALAEAGIGGGGDLCATSAITPVLTPHDGEFARLNGGPVGHDRIAATRALAAHLGAVVLLKGPTTVIADPSGQTYVTTSGDARLATAGTGDVLAGVIGAGLACGLDPLTAAAFGAELHGLGARRLPEAGMTAGDLPSGVAAALSELRSPNRGLVIGH